MGFFFGKRTKGKHEEEEGDLCYDAYTGLGNGNLLHKICTETSTTRTYSFSMIILNQFNHLNTLFGLDITGRTVKALANELREYARKQGGMAFRLQLDQLAVLIPCEEEKREEFIEGLEEQLKAMEEVHFQSQEVIYHQHYTFTYLTYFLSYEDEDTPDMMNIIENMTSQLENMEQVGETHGDAYNDKGQPNWKQQKILLQDVQRGWENKEFIPYYQLLYEAKTKRPIGAEILARWQHPELGLLLPDEFLPILENKGYILNLDLYMLEEACKKIKHWLEEELVSVPITINISRLNLHRQNFVGDVIDIVTRYEIPPSLIILEMQERAILYELDDHYISIMDRFHEFGFVLSMDHFAATEFSSINILRTIPVDAIKLSPRFFPQEGAPEQEIIFVKWVLRLAKTLKIRTIGENIEQEKDVAQLLKYGCEHAQGFYFSKPMSNEEFEAIIF